MAASLLKRRISTRLRRELKIQNQRASADLTFSSLPSIFRRLHDILKRAVY